MPYSFSAGDRTLAIELGTLRKLGKARRLASANSVNRTARRLDAPSAAPEEPPRPGSQPRSPVDIALE
jgi:hypothetical protein